jgi:hypothetical protein
MEQTVDSAYSPPGDQRKALETVPDTISFSDWAKAQQLRAISQESRTGYMASMPRSSQEPKQING